MSSLPKPVLRGHLRRSGIKMLAGAVTFAITAGALYKVFVAIPRQNAYNEFINIKLLSTQTEASLALLSDPVMEVYDPEQHFQELVKYDLLQSVRMTKNK